MGYAPQKGYGMKPWEAKKARKELREILTALLDRSERVCEDGQGGYPDDGDIVGDNIVIAGLDDFKERQAPLLTCIPGNQARKKWRAAKRMLASGDADDIDEAMWENGL